MATQLYMTNPAHGRHKEHNMAHKGKDGHGGKPKRKKPRKKKNPAGLVEAAKTVGIGLGTAGVIALTSWGASKVASKPARVALFTGVGVVAGGAAAALGSPTAGVLIAGSMGVGAASAALSPAPADAARMAQMAAAAPPAQMMNGPIDLGERRARVQGAINIHS